MFTSCVSLFICVPSSASACMHPVQLSAIYFGVDLRGWGGGGGGRH